jgi:hypothetical protein
MLKLNANLSKDERIKMKYEIGASKKILPDFNDPNITLQLKDPYFPKKDKDV